MTKTLPIANRRLPIDFGGMARGRLSRSHAAGARPSPGAAINKRRTGAELAGRRPAIRTFIRQGAEDLRSFNPSGRVHVAAPGDGRAPAAFSLVELLLVMTLLSLIVFALMAVFNSTQKAFRASVTQTDVLEGSRAAVELIASDLRGLTPSGFTAYRTNSPVNFSVWANGNVNNAYQPLIQNLPGGSSSRTNLLNYFFALGRVNTKWTGVGYVVDATSTNTLYPLYRFYAETNVAASPWGLYNAFTNEIAHSAWTNMSHVIDGVVHLTVRAQDLDGRWINDDVQPYTNALDTVFFYPPAVTFGYGEAQIYMYSNTVPASVELDLGVMEDATIARAESLPNNAPGLPPNDARTQFLEKQSGRVHLFRQRVTIPNVDPTAYQ